MLDGYGVEVPTPGRTLSIALVAGSAIGLIGVAIFLFGMVVVGTVGAPRSQIRSDLDTTLAYGCGYNAGAAMVLQKWTGSYPDKIRETCQKIKETAAANGFTQ